MLDLINIDLIVAICELLKHPFKLICMWLMAKLFEKYPDLPQQIALIRHGQQSPQTLVVNVFLKPVNHCCCCSDSFDETEIIPLSGVIKSGAGCIRLAGGCCGFRQLWTTGRDAQPLSAVTKVSTQTLNFTFCIC